MYMNDLPGVAIYMQPFTTIWVFEFSLEFEENLLFLIVYKQLQI